MGACVLNGQSNYPNHYKTPQITSKPGLSDYSKTPNDIPGHVVSLFIQIQMNKTCKMLHNRLFFTILKQKYLNR